MTSWLPKLSSTSGPAYLALAAALIDDIEGGRLQPGFRLPTQRSLAYKLGLSVTTVTNAYTVVLKRGLISGHVGRGTYVTGDKISQQFPDQPEKGTIDLSLNRPVSGASERALAATLAEMAEEADLRELLDYGPSLGLPRHRSAAVELLAMAGVQAHADQIVLCGGAQHAYTVAASTLLSPGDVALSEMLTSPLLIQLSRLLQLRLHGVPVDESGLIPEALEDMCAAMKPRVLFCTPNLQDPTGSILPVERRKKIAEIAMRHDMAIVEDDRFGFFVDRTLPSLRSFAPDHTIYFTCTSKCLGPGLRISYMVAPPRMLDRVQAGVRMTLWIASPLSAEVVTRWIKSGTARSLIRAQKREIEKRYALASAALDDMPNWSPRHPSMHLWLHLPEHWSSLDFAAQARSAHVIVAPDIAFLAGRAGTQHCIRISISSPDTASDLQRGLDTLRAILRQKPVPTWGATLSN